MAGDWNKLTRVNGSSTGQSSNAQATIIPANTNHLHNICTCYSVFDVGPILYKCYTNVCVAGILRYNSSVWIFIIVNYFDDQKPQRKPWQLYASWCAHLCDSYKYESFFPAITDATDENVVSRAPQYKCPSARTVYSRTRYDLSQASDWSRWPFNPRSRLYLF